MKNMNVKSYVKRLFTAKAYILVASAALLYLLSSLYFVNHFFFNTVINGVDVSLKTHADAEAIIKSHFKDYRLQLIERNAETEEIIGQDIEMQYNIKNSIPKIYEAQHSYKWPISLLKKQNYYVVDLFVYNEEALVSKINGLKCLNEDIIEPQNVGFKYTNGSYELIAEVYGNKINKDIFFKAVKMSLLKGETKLNLNEKLCYENPKYTSNSKKAIEVKKLLDKYISTRITYQIRNKTEVLDKDTINQWLSVDEDMEVVINEKAVRAYMQRLGKKYDTAGVTRKFKTSLNKIVEVKGGFYGWKIDRDAEIKALLKNLKHGEIVEREPIYAQKAFTADEDEIGDTYVEVNISRQYLWFYKNGKLIAKGAIVTGNPNKGYSTKQGAYMLNYKEEKVTLVGHDYEAVVNYWMPFNGNIGIHDATWRYSFGGSIYERNGSHGCVNVPLYLAKRIYDKIEEGTPVICYEEEDE